VELLKDAVMLASALTLLIRDLDQLHNLSTSVAEPMTRVGFLVLAATIFACFF
jgi:hypothetical protein